MEDSSANGWRLLKANVTLNTNSAPVTEEEWQSHPEEMIVAAQLLELIERESARRFVVHCGQKSGLLVCASSDTLTLEFTYSHLLSALGLQSRLTIFKFIFRIQRQRPTSHESVLSEHPGR
jgi:hypothetical protein